MKKLLILSLLSVASMTTVMAADGEIKNEVSGEGKRNSQEVQIPRTNAENDLPTIVVDGEQTKDPATSGESVVHTSGDAAAKSDDKSASGKKGFCGCTLF